MTIEAKKECKDLMFSIVQLVQACAKVLHQDSDELTRTALTDTFDFLMFLAGSDDNVSDEEADLISEMIGQEFSPEKIERIIQNRNLYGEAFVHSVPGTFEYLLKCEPIFAEKGYKGQRFLEMFIETMMHIGNCMIRIDGIVNEKEAESLSQYYKNLSECKSQKR